MDRGDESVKTALDHARATTAPVHMQDATWIFFTVCGEHGPLQTVNDWGYVDCSECLAKRPKEGI